MAKVSPMLDSHSFHSSNHSFRFALHWPLKIFTVRTMVTLACGVSLKLTLRPKQEVHLQKSGGLRIL